MTNLADDDLNAQIELADSRVARIRTMVPVKVVSYDHTTKRATVQPIPQVAYRNADGSITQEDQPTLASIPVAEVGNGDMSLTFSLSAGDEGVLLVMGRSLSEYLQTGADTTTPKDLRRFSMRDGILLPVFFRAASSGDRATGAVVVKGSDIRLGSSTATEYVALGQKTSTAINLRITVFNAHTHIGNLGIPTSTPATPMTSTTSAELAATKVKAE